MNYVRQKPIYKGACKTWLLVLASCCLAISGQAKFAQAADAGKRILIVGDSLTAGYGVSQESAFPAQLQNLLVKKGHQVRVIAAGSSGATSASAVGRLKWHLKSKPDLLVLALGANDGLRGLPVTSTRDNLLAAIQLAKGNAIPVVLAGMKMPLNYGEDYRQSYEKVFTDLASQEKIPLVPFLLEGVGGVPTMNLPDGIHPNEKGHARIAETLQKALEPLL